VTTKLTTNGHEWTRISQKETKGTKNCLDAEDGVLSGGYPVLYGLFRMDAQRARVGRWWLNDFSNDFFKNR
jgi:hypothetical protein